jgi:hypothetical protein
MPPAHRPLPGALMRRQNVKRQNNWRCYLEERTMEMLGNLMNILIASLKG